MPKADQELIITLKKGTQPRKSFHAGKHFSVGSDYASDLTVQGTALPATLLEFKQRGKGCCTLSFSELPASITGTLKKGDSTVNFRDLTVLGLIKEHKGKYVIELRPGIEGVVTVAGSRGTPESTSTISFNFQRLSKEHQAVRPAVKIPRMPLFTGNELAFTILLIVSLLIHIGSVKYLEGIDITAKSDIEEIKKMEPRFARLILKPKKRERVKTAVIEIKEDEVKVKEVKEEPKPDTKKKDAPEKTKNKTKPKPQKEAATQQASAGTEEIRKRDLSKRVKKKGVLGIISSKESLLGTVKRDQVWRDVDAIIATAEYGSDKGETLAGLGGQGEVTRAKGLVKADAPRARSTSEIMRDKQSGASFDTASGETISETPGPGGREEGEVYGVVKRYVGGLKYLYNKALRKDSSLRGLVTVRIIINANGKVKDVKIIKSNLDSEPLLDSIKSRIYLWRFKNMPDAPDFTIDYTFDFSPVG